MIGFPHNPLIYVLTRGDPAKWAADTADFVRRADEIRQDLERTRPDVILLIGSDHLHQFFMHNMPAFAGSPPRSGSDAPSCWRITGSPQSGATSWRRR